MGYRLLDKMHKIDSPSDSRIECDSIFLVQSLLDLVRSAAAQRSGKRRSLVTAGATIFATCAGWENHT